MFSIDNQLVKAPGTILPHILAILLTGFLGLVGGETPEAAAAAMTTQDQDEVPATEEIFYQRGVDYLGRFRKDDIGQAVRLFNRVVKTDPRNPQGHAGLAEARAIQYLLGWEPDRQMLDKGVVSGKRAVELGPDSAEAHLGLGLALMAADQYTSALEELERAAAMNPKSFRTHLYRGLLLRGLRRTQEALFEVRRAIELAPASAVARAVLGDCHQDERQFKEARAAYLTAAELDQRLLWPRLGLAAAYQRETNFAAAEKTYLVTEHDFPEEATRIHILAASLLVASQRYDDATEMYQAISEQESVSPPLFRRLMQAGRAFSLERLDRKEEAEYFWNKVVEEFPTDFDGSFRDRELASQAYEALARIYDSKGESRRADKVLDRGCRNRGMTYSLHAALAEKQRSAGRLEEAVVTLRRGLKETPPDEDWVTATQKILPTLRSVASARVSSKTSSESVGLLQDLAGRVEQAAPTSFVPYLNVARGEALLRQTPRALEHLRQAMERGYGGIRTAAGDPDFKALVQEPAFRAMAGNP